MIGIIFILFPLFVSRQRRPKHIVDLVRQSCALISHKVEDLITIQENLSNKQDFFKLLKTPLWDEFDWHCSVEKHGKELTARYIFVLDSLNYCFWPSNTGLEYENLARGLRKACEGSSNEQFLNLKNCSEERIKSWLEKPHEFPLLKSRIEAIHSLGEAFEKYGDACEWISEANGSAVRLVDIIQKRLSKFRDENFLFNERVCFYKRAQILVADIWAAFGQNRNGNVFGGFYDMDRLTMFADYRVPQLLREMGILEYSKELASKIDSKIELKPGSSEEIAIRATSVHAVELMKKYTNLISVEIDWLLWQHGESTKKELKPNHRTLTIFY